MSSHDSNGYSDTQTKSAVIKPVLVFAAGFALLNLAGLILLPAHVQDVLVFRGAGVAIGALLVMGRRIWPGIILGSMVSQGILAYVGLIVVDSAFDVISAVILSIAMASQAIIGARLIRKIGGFPIRLRGFGHVALLALVAMPLTCLIVPTFGIALHHLPSAPVSVNLVHNWWVWWVGDLIGVCLAVPVALLGPWNTTPLVFWKKRAMPRFSGQSLIYLTLSVAITLMSWSFVSRLGEKADRAQFEALVLDNSLALRHRLAVYHLALGGGVGLVRASDRVTAADWHIYVQSLDLSKNLLGINGIGFIQPVAPEQVESFLAEAKADGLSDLKIKPAATKEPMFVIKYLEPIETNRQAVGLNIAFEKKRYNAAIAARDTGEATISEPVVLVQDQTKGTGLLMLVPVYSGEASPQTVEARRAAFVGWVYSPIITNQLLDNLTASHGVNLETTIYDGESAASGPIIYSNARDRTGMAPALYRIEDHINLFGESWTIIWESTPNFEAKLYSFQPLATLVGGLSFSLLFAIFLLSLTRREELVRQTVALRTRELAAQVEENRSIIETAIAKIVLLDGEGRVMRVNDALLRLLGVLPQDLIGKPLSGFFEGQMDEYFNQLSEGDRHPIYRGEMHTTSSSGQRLTLDLQAIPWKTSSNERRYTVVMRNITDQRRVEAQLRNTQHRLNLALTGAKIGVFDIDLQTGESVVSHTWRELLGISDDDSIDTQKHWFDRVHPEDRSIVATADQDCIEGRTTQSISEYRIRMPDDTWRWMRSDAVGEDRDENGRARRLIGLQTDVTDQRQVDELKKQFVSTVSHELRTPLTSINGSLSLLLNAMSAGIPEASRRMLLIAQKNCDRLIHLVNDILDLEKLESGPRKPKLAPAELSVQVQRAIQVNQPFAARFDVDYALVRDAPGTIVNIEDVRFQQIMANLLSNAAKFSPRGGTVDIAIDSLGDWVKVSVTDRGCGIPAEFHDRIFKAFSQVDGSSSRMVEGTGLGLHIAKKIVEQLDGEIGFNSEPGVATTFWVKLPLLTEPIAQVDQRLPLENSETLAVATPRILHVEDNGDFAEVLSAAFGTQAVVVNAANRIAASKLLANESFDLVILDWDLGTSSGIALLNELPAWKHQAPIIALTAAEQSPNDPRVEITFIKSRVQLDEVARKCLGLIERRRRERP